MTPVPAARQSPSVPTVFVVGFPVHEVLIQQYRGRVIFQKEYESVQRPDQVPEGIMVIYMSNKVYFPHRARMCTLAKAVPDRVYEELSGLVELQDKLDQRFPKTDPVAASLHIVKPAVPEVAPPVPTVEPSEVDPGLAKIRGLSRTPDTIVAWVRDNMRWPCNPPKEARRLVEELSGNEKFASAKESTVLNYIRGLIQDAGLSSRSGPPREFIPRAPGSATGTVHELGQDLQRQLATYTENLVVGMRAITDALADSEDRANVLQEELIAARREAQEYKRDALAYRRIKADVLKETPQQ